jgi:hypothetical protein
MSGLQSLRYKVGEIRASDILKNKLMKAFDLILLDS